MILGQNLYLVLNPEMAASIPENPTR